MSPVSKRYRRLSQAFADRVAAVPADAWDRPTPCEDWTVLDLVRHVVDSQGMFPGFVGLEPAPIPPVEDDPGAAWDAARAVVQAGLDDPAVATAGFDGFFGPSTYEEAVDRFANFDLVVHGWDLATATGQDDRIAPEDLDRVRETARSFGDMLRSNGVCGPEVDPAPGADEQAQLLAFLGRTP